jgi:hypothetical protein
VGEARKAGILITLLVMLTISDIPAARAHEFEQPVEAEHASHPAEREQDKVFSGEFFIRFRGDPGAETPNKDARYSGIKCWQPQIFATLWPCVDTSCGRYEMTDDLVTLHLFEKSEPHCFTGVLRNKTTGVQFRHSRNIQKRRDASVTQLMSSRK